MPGKFSTEKEDSITYNKMNGYLYVITITERVHKYVSRVKCVQIWLDHDSEEVEVPQLH